MKSTYSDKNLEEFIQKHFEVKLKFDEVLARDMAVSYSAEATIFRAEKGKLYAFISGESRLTLGDIQKFLSKMNIKSAKIFPPNGQKKYFSERARLQFLEIFPSRHHISDEELRYYKTRVPYNPALVEIAEIKDGELRCFNADSVGTWRTFKRISYKKII
ncbi:MAG: hypothetical protein Q4A21_01435 [bacterium]|nr:hypothetical protein [bacterium]